MIAIKETGEGSLFSVRVQSRAPADGIVGEHAGALKVCVTAPPEKGKANAAVIALLAQELGVSRSSIEIVRGKTSRNKTVRIRGLTRQELFKLLQRANK